MKLIELLTADKREQMIDVHILAFCIPSHTTNKFASSIVNLIDYMDIFIYNITLPVIKQCDNILEDSTSDYRSDGTLSDYFTFFTLRLSE